MLILAYLYISGKKFMYRKVSLVASLTMAWLSLFCLAVFDSRTGVPFDTEDWIESTPTMMPVLASSWNFSIDGLSIWLIILTVGINASLYCNFMVYSNISFGSFNIFDISNTIIVDRRVYGKRHFSFLSII